MIYTHSSCYYILHIYHRPLSYATVRQAHKVNTHVIYDCRHTWVTLQDISYWIAIICGLHSAQSKWKCEISYKWAEYYIYLCLGSQLNKRFFSTCYKLRLKLIQFECIHLSIRPQYECVNSHNYSWKTAMWMEEQQQRQIIPRKHGVPLKTRSTQMCACVNHKKICRISVKNERRRLCTHNRTATICLCVCVRMDAKLRYYSPTFIFYIWLIFVPSHSHMWWSGTKWCYYCSHALLNMCGQCEKKIAFTCRIETIRARTYTNIHYKHTQPSNRFD